MNTNITLTQMMEENEKSIIRDHKKMLNKLVGIHLPIELMNALGLVDSNIDHSCIRDFLKVENHIYDKKGYLLRIQLKGANFHDMFYFYVKVVKSKDSVRWTKLREVAIDLSEANPEFNQQKILDTIREVGNFK